MTFVLIISSPDYGKIVFIAMNKANSDHYLYNDARTTNTITFRLLNTQRQMNNGIQVDANSNHCDRGVGKMVIYWWRLRKRTLRVSVCRNGIFFCKFYTFAEATWSIMDRFYNVNRYDIKYTMAINIDVEHISTTSI